MINRWQGNSGRVQRLPERQDKAPNEPRHIPQPPRSMPPLYSRQSGGSGLSSALEGIKKLLPLKTEQLETEDIILLLILYLMYRESGDSELLMIMGAMFLL